jgi:folate-binding Fe-S cluster repair protein YgfZ
MVSNDVSAGEVFDALLLTPKARVIAPLRVWRRGEDDFLLLTEPELAEAVRTTLLRSRFAAKCEVEL